MASKREIRKVVDSMTPDEILKLFGDQDATFIDYRKEELNKIYIKRLFPNTKEMKILGSNEFERSDGLHIVLIYLDKGNSFSKNNRLGVRQYFWFNYRGGISAVRFLPDKRFGMMKYFYSNHFIERYRERELHDLSISKPEALKTFLINNSKRAIQRLPSEKYPNNGWMITNQGLCFMEVKQDDFIVMKTFLPWNMINVGQQTVSFQMIIESIQQGFKFPVPDELIDQSDINLLEFPN